MKTLTLTQPWATLVATGAKRIETRSWSTSYRGPLAIHAAKGFPRWAKDMCRAPGFNLALSGENLPTGAVIATCKLIDCVRSESVIAIVSIAEDIHGYSQGQDGLVITDQEEYFGDYGPGRFLWLLADVTLLPDPDPVNGALGLWEWDDDRYWQRREDFGPNGDATTPGFFIDPNRGAA